MAKPNLEQMARSFIGSSAASSQLRDTIAAIAPSSFPVLIVGETGTGKEVVAKLLHEHSQRSSGPFVAVNCAAFPEELAHAELFGYEKGAFTGADRERSGIFEKASGGTLYLDELESLPLPIQAALLSALDDSTIRRIGSDIELKVDVRIISATNADLNRPARDSSLRHDLVDRLTLIRVPPLRDRLDDIPELVEHFLAQMSEQHDRRIGIDKNALQRLREYDYPGNVRQLRNNLY